MAIDIDQLSEEQLRDLNHRIVERLRFLQQMRAHVQMLEFRIGDKVSFPGHGGVPESGTITRYNKKSVSIVTDRGERWTVHPSLLQRTGSSRPDQPIPVEFRLAEK